MGVIQFALWQHAEHIASAVAQQGVFGWPSPRRNRSSREERSTERAASARLHRAGRLQHRRHPHGGHDDRDGHRLSQAFSTNLLAPGQSGGGRAERDRTSRTPMRERTTRSGRAPQQRGRRVGQCHRPSWSCLRIPLLILFLLFVVALGPDSPVPASTSTGPPPKRREPPRSPRTRPQRQAAARQTAAAAFGSDHVACAQLGRHDEYGPVRARRVGNSDGDLCGRALGT